MISLNCRHSAYETGFEEAYSSHVKLVASRSEAPEMSARTVVRQQPEAEAAQARLALDRCTINMDRGSIACRLEQFDS